MYVLKNKAGADGLTAFVYGERASLLPFQAYLNPSSAEQHAAALTIRIEFDDSFMDDTTGINSTPSDGNALNGYRYSLDGMKIGNPLYKGLYIKNNKKYLGQ